MVTEFGMFCEYSIRIKAHNLKVVGSNSTPATKKYQ